MKLKINLITTILILVTFTFSLAAQTKEFKGVVYDQVRRSTIEACNIRFLNAEGEFVTGTVSNLLGVFYLDLDKYPTVSQIEVSHVIYESKIIALPKANAVAIEVQLLPRVYSIDDVTVCSSYSSNNKGNQFAYTPMEAASSVSIIGEPDVVRHISSLPGVSQGMEGSLGLFVRGGNTGSNRIEFNQVPVYSFSHLLGLFSSFAPDIIEKSVFKPGGLPAESGNLSSSLMQITPKVTTSRPQSTKLTISPYMTGGYLSMPVIKDTLSIQLSARTSFLPYLANAFETGEGDTKANVLDITSIIDWRINDRNRMDAMVYISSDYFDFKDSEAQSIQEWGSRAFKLGWHSQLNPRLSTSLWSYYNRTYAAQQQVSFDSYEEEEKTSDLRLGTTLDEFAINAKAAYRLSKLLNLSGGVEYRHQLFIPSTEKVLFKEKKQSNYQPKQPVGAISLNAQMDYEKEGSLKLMFGSRYTTQKGEEDSNSNIDIHALVDIYITNRLGVELTADRMVQYFHVLEGLPTGWSFNIMTPANDVFPEEITHQAYAGFFWQKKVGKTTGNITIGGFYRDMQNLLSYKSTVNLFGINDATWEDEVALGSGKSKGIELSAMMQHKKLGATLAYTLSDTDRQFDEINNGESFPFKFDRRHMLNAQAKYKVLERINKKNFKREHYFNTVFSFSSGHKATLPVAVYQGVMPPFWDQRETSVGFPPEVDQNAFHRQEMTARNSFKMEDYFRLDLAYTMVKYRTKSTHELTFSVFNVLNRQNPYLYFYSSDKWQQLSIAPIMPSVRWAVSF